MRTRTIVQLHFVNPVNAFVWPIVITAASLALVIAISAMVLTVAGQNGSDLEAVREGINRGMVWNGAVFALIGPLLGFGFTAMGQYFPLALGLGFSRREYAIGAGIVFVINAAVFATIITIGKVIEVATNGYGLSARFFDVAYTGTGPFWQTFVQTFLLLLAIAFVSALITAAFHRWGQAFLWVFWIGIATVVVAFVAGLLFVPGMKDGLTTIATMGWAPWMIVLTLIGAAAAGGWLLLVRRAQVR